jgi:hypothetical protein
MPPVLVVYNNNPLSVYQVIAFAFDFYNTPVKVPMVAVNETNTSDEDAYATAPSWLSLFKKLVLIDYKKTMGNVPVKVKEATAVFQPVCLTSYVVFRLTGTSKTRAVSTPIAITPTYNQASSFVSAVVANSIRSRATSTSYTVLPAPVQFFISPDQVTSYMLSVIRSMRRR